MDKHIERILFNSNYVANNPLNEVFINEDDDEVISLDDLNVGDDNNVEQEIKLSASDVESDKDVLKKHNEILSNVLNKLKEVDNVISEIDEFINNIERDRKDVTAEVGLRIEKLENVVEELKDPSNYEKLSGKSEYSDPYNNNMSNVWNSDKYSFKNNIVKMDDGTYVGIFDNIDSLISSNNIEGTFYEYK